MSVELNNNESSSILNKSDLLQSAFQAKKTALEIENELDTIKKRIKKIQIEEEKKHFQKKHLLEQMDKLKGIYMQIKENRQQKQQRHVQQEQESLQLRNKAQDMKVKSQKEIQNVIESVKNLKHKEMLDIQTQRKRHEDFIRQMKDQDIQKKRKQKEDVQKMLEKSALKKKIFYQEKIVATNQFKQFEIEQSVDKLSKAEHQIKQILVQQEKMRQNFDHINKSTIETKIQVEQLPRQGVNSIQISTQPNSTKGEDFSSNGFKAKNSKPNSDSNNLKVQENGSKAALHTNESAKHNNN